MFGLYYQLGYKGGKQLKLEGNMTVMAMALEGKSRKIMMFWDKYHFIILTNCNNETSCCIIFFHVHILYTV